MKYLATLAMAAFTFASCETDVEQVQLAPETEFVAPVLNEQGDIIVNADNVDVEAVTFTCSEADFGQAVAISYNSISRRTARRSLWPSRTIPLSRLRRPT